MRDGENLRGFRRIVPTAGDGTLDLKAGESATVQLALDRTGATDTNATYGSVLAVRDEGGSGMRVPLMASADPGADLSTGLWAGVKAYGPEACGDDGTVTFRRVKRPGESKGFFTIGASGSLFALGTGHRALNDIRR